MKNVLVTGGSGFVGRHLIYEMLKRYPDIHITSVSRSEGAIFNLFLECPCERLNLFMADVRDRDAIKYAVKGKDTVLHLAAMKRVDLSEDQCREATTTNIIGTLNVLDYFEGKTFILMSSDKAVEPVNCYGATKLVAEKVVWERSRKAQDGSRFMVVRSGNIIDSTGSVLDIWRHQIKESNEITVTHPDMLRYYVPIQDVVGLFISTLERGENGKIYFTPRGEAILVKDLVARAIKLYGNERTKIRYIGLRPGERMEEKMCSDCESNAVPGFLANSEQAAKTPLAIQ